MLDAFLSLYEATVEDRRLLTPGHPLARWLKRVERAAYEKADLVILDKNAHIDYVSAEFGIPREKFVRVLVGADDRLFTPPPADDRPTESREVLFYGKFIPLHGVEHIVRAAHILRSVANLRFTLIGTGQTYADARKLASDLQVPSIRWLDWVEYRKLPEYIMAADVCLGAFGAAGKAMRVVPSKVFQALACGSRVITADTPAVRELPDCGEALLLVPPAESEALAEAVRSACDTRLPLRRAPGVEEFLPARLGPTLLEAVRSAANIA